MVRHLTIGVANPIEVSDDSFHNLQEFYPIGIILIDRFPSVASGSDMIKGALEFNSNRPRHAVKRSQEMASFLDLTLNIFITPNDV